MKNQTFSLRSQTLFQLLLPIIVLLLCFPELTPAQEAGVRPQPGTAFPAGETILNLDNRVNHSGELRYFQAYSSRGGRMILKVYRLEGERLVQVGSSALITLPAGEVGTFSCSIPVSRGDIVGCYCPDTNCVDRLDDGGVLVAEGDVGCAPSSVFDEERGAPAIFAAGSEIFDSPSTASTNLVVPVVARGNGAHASVWRSSLALFNTSETETQVVLYFNLAMIDNTEPAASTQIILPARANLLIDDLLRDSFGIEEAAGSLDIVASAPVMAHARIFNSPSDGGSFGQLVPAIPLHCALGDDLLPGINPHAATAVLYPIVENERYRSNLGISNVSGVPLSLEIRAFDATVVLAAPLDIEVPPYSQRQINRILNTLGLSSDENDIRLEISARTGGAGRFFAYLSTVDNLSGDPVFLLADHEAP